MLDKIKTLREIIEPKAVSVGQSFEEVLEAMCEEERFKLFAKQVKHMLRVSPLWYPANLIDFIDVKKMIRYISDNFYINIEKNKYNKWLKLYITNSINEYDQWLQNASPQRAFIINVPYIGFDGRSLIQGKNEKDIWYQKRLSASKDNQNTVKYFIEVLGIDLMTNKNQVIILNGPVEFKIWKNSLKNHVR